MRTEIVLGRQETVSCVIHPATGRRLDWRVETGESKNPGKRWWRPQWWPEVVVYTEARQWTEWTGWALQGPREHTDFWKGLSTCSRETVSDAESPHWAMRALPLTQPLPEETSHHSLQAFKQACACHPPIKRVSPESSKSRSSFSGPFCKSDLTLRKSLI